MVAKLAAGALSMLMAGLALAAYVRGSSASAEMRDPTEPRDGVLCSLLRAAEDPAPIRCAAIAEAPAERVFALVTDYRAASTAFDTAWLDVRVSSVERELDDRVHFAGSIAFFHLPIPIDVRITHSQSADAHVAAWSESAASRFANRGSWTVRRVAEGTSLVIYELAVAAPWVPQFAMNDALLAGLPSIVARVATDLKTAR